MDEKAKADSNNKISSLDVSRNQLGDEGLKLIIEWLRFDRHLENNHSDEDSQYSGEGNNSERESPESAPSDSEVQTGSGERHR